MIRDTIMKRDMDLIRAILFRVEAEPSGFAPQHLEIPEYTQEEILYHMHLLGEAGLAKVVDITTMGSKSPQAMIVSLTWTGHEFLDVARENQIWNQAKDKINQIGGATLQIWLAVLTSLIQKKIGL